MKTSVIEVHDMLSVLSLDEVERRIGEVAGVESVTVNFSAGNATVRFDETRLKIADIKSGVRQGGFDSAAPGTAATAESHQGHTAPEAPPATPPSAPPKTPEAAPSSGGASTGASIKEKVVPASPAHAGAENQDKGKG